MCVCGWVFILFVWSRKELRFLWDEVKDEVKVKDKG